MQPLAFRRCALSTSLTATLLAGCGGSQMPGAIPNAMPQSSLTFSRSIEPSARRPSSYQVLHRFKGDPDGDEPYAGMIVVNGTLYGTTFKGGKLGLGTVFAITKSGTETVLHSFGSSGDGRYPLASLINVDGTLYGTTEEGGANTKCDSGGGCGTVFAITGAGTETVLHSFKGGSDGENPQAALINVGGTLYGTTIYGGLHHHGTVFAITNTGMETVLHSFGGSGDGKSPNAGLVNLDGTLYGTTVDGGRNGLGTVFAITKTGRETVLHSFKGGSGDGASPDAGLASVNGMLYGTTFSGGGSKSGYSGYDVFGTVFAIAKTGMETVLYRFKGGAEDGEFPRAGLVNVKGTLYGTTQNGGAKGAGTIFSITTSGKEIVLHSSSGCPDAGLVNLDSTLYGTTSEGGANGRGIVFSLTR